MLLQILSVPRTPLRCQLGYFQYACFIASPCSFKKLYDGSIGNSATFKDLTYCIKYLTQTTCRKTMHYAVILITYNQARTQRDSRDSRMSAIKILKPNKYPRFSKIFLGSTLPLKFKRSKIIYCRRKTM